MLSKVGAGVVVTCLVASCSVVGPTYERPQISLETRFAFDPNNALHTAASDAWWLGFKDPVLDRLMTRALAKNLDVQAAVARIRQAEAQVRATGVASQLSGESEANARVSWTDGTESDTADARLAPSFVLDLFGEQTRRREAAAARRDRAVFEAAAARLALQLAVVDAFLDLRYFQALENLRTRAIRNQQGVVNAVRQREAFSAESTVTLRRSEAELQLQRALLPEAQQGQTAAALRLATLLAEPFRPLMRDLEVRPSQPHAEDRIAPGLPAALLKNRPDVRAAEARLRAAVARIGVTEAQLYPSVRLNGLVTVGADSTLALGPTVSLPLFTRTTRVANRDAALAEAEEAELLWRSVVQNSVEEVQRNLSALRTSGQQVTALSQAVAKFRDAARLSREAFRLQAITHIEILDVEDRLTEAELRLISAHRANARAWAQLNVATGQGWRAGVDGQIGPN